MYSSCTSALLFAICMTCVNGFNYSNISHPIYTTYSRLRQDILNRPVSVHRIPPCLDSGYRKRYELQLANLFVNIYSFDEIKQIMTIQFYFGMTWYHSELTWDPSDYDNISIIWIDSSNIWIPKIEVNMGFEETSTLDFSGELSLTSDGAIEFMKLGFLSFACNIDFYHYPFDSQVCTFGFYPHGPPYAQPVFYKNNFSLSKIYNVSGEWSFQKIDNYILPLTDLDNENVILMPTYRLVVRRNSMYYVVCIVFPLVLTSVMIPLVFVIPPETGEKVSYLVALFTSTAVFLNYISDVMPRCLHEMPYMALLLTEVLVEGLLTMLATLFVVNVHSHENAKKRKFNGLRLNNKVGTISHDFPDSKQMSSDTKKSQTYDPECPMSKKLDRIFLFCFFIGHISYLLLLFLASGWIEK